MTPPRKALPDPRSAIPLLAALLCVAPPACADDYRDARAELVAAYEEADYTRMQAAARRALAARPAYPAGLFNLALAQALGGDSAMALTTLGELAAMHIDPGADSMPEFDSLHALPGWPAYVEILERLRRPVGQARVAWRYDQGDFVPEGIALDSSGGVFLGSIRFGTIVHVNGTASVVASPGPHWSVYGMRLRDGRLWFVSSAVDQYADVTVADSGRNGLFSVAANGGSVYAELELPASDRLQVLGDLEFDGDGVVYLADQTDGVVYRYERPTHRLSELVPKGRIGSPQGLVVAGDVLYVADYIGGLYRVALPGGGVEPVPADSGTSLYGIDGLYRYGDGLIAIQNGIRPNRVVLLRLGDDGRRVVSSRILAMNLPEFDEPNLGQVQGDTFYFIANSHWNRFDADGGLPEDLDGPVVLAIDLGKAANTN